jgi:hypothetical protein
MNSNNHPSAYGYQPPKHGVPPVPAPYARPYVQEDTLKEAVIQIERKAFIITLKENVRGRLLRITEEVGGRRSTIIIPSTGLKEFQQLLEDMIKADAATTPKNKI